MQGICIILNGFTALFEEPYNTDVVASDAGFAVTDESL